MLVLAGIAVIVLGFALRFNPLLVVVLAGIVTGLAAGWHPADVVAALGRAFVANRFIAVPWLVLPVIGLLERGGLREQARVLMARLKVASAGGVLGCYFLVRQATAALGLVSLGGPVQMVRPLVAPMAEAAAERAAPLDEDMRQRIRAHSAAVDNIALFFGEDLFVAIGSILLIRATLAQFGIAVTPPQLAFWAMPTAAAALVVHGVRLWLLDRTIRRAGR
jgi:uncharacterized membrane protein